MNFRSLVNKAKYKNVFNAIHKSHYSSGSHTGSQITEIDLAYFDVFNKLKKLPTKDSSKLELHLEDAELDKEKYIAVNLYDGDEDQLYALDFQPWSDLIDCEVKSHAKLTDDEIVAHLLWEITFWGFSEERIAEQAKSLPSID